MKLIELKVEKNINGLGSDTYSFGKRLTHLSAKNGSGKTPLIHFAMYALGLPIDFRDLLYEKCKSVKLLVENDDSMISIERTIDKKVFFIRTINMKSQEQEEHTDEKSFSTFLFRILSKNVPVLTDKGAKPTQPYMSSYLPLFFLNQNTGYHKPYTPPRDFIRDQCAEMIRFCLDLSPKHLYDKKKKEFDLKSELNKVETNIKATEDLLSKLYKEDNKESDLSSISERISALTKQLEDLKSSSETRVSISKGFEQLINDKKQDLMMVKSAISSISQRVNGFITVKKELETEINTLNLNQEAKMAFESFSEICANKSCGLFSASQDHYVKNLFYLKDQLKDIDTTVESLKSELDSKNKLYNKLDSDYKILLEDDSLSLHRDETTQVVEIVRKLTLELIELEHDKSFKESINEKEVDLTKLIFKKDKAIDDLELLKKSGASSNPKLIRYRQQLNEKAQFWLKTLNTKNIPETIEFDHDFTLTMGSEKIKQFDGSTRARIVIAYHTALFELIMKETRNNFRFLVLDTPKQHELEHQDLDEYIKVVSKLADELNFQVIFSSTEYDSDLSNRDTVWKPQYNVGGDLRYLGENV